MMLKLESLRTKSEKELMKESSKLREKLAQLRKDLKVKDMKEVSQIKKVRRDIARVETLIRELNNKKKTEEDNE